jgi:hypothetical protein
MKRSELKEVLKPLIKECIKEVLFEDGVLSGIISEVIRGTGNAPMVVTEAKQTEAAKQEHRLLSEQQEQKRIKQLKETRKQMLDVIGNSTFNGVDLFEGTTPMVGAGSATPEPQSPLSNYAPEDTGVDISGIMDVARGKWKQLL